MTRRRLIPRDRVLMRDCPRCGSERVKAAASQASEDYVTTACSCLVCGFSVETEDNFADYGTAILLWNRAK